ncbi:transaldolase [Rhabdothermincola salaria]|uniref:transaldolase n=1 Tax=Rhabdothermincola salaria TaxID=2903142 RepID=UPI001E54F42F|nr:transaldolase [Rhabdothermincola salaria]MCD9623040.1 transaldolase [Rhabdothermincola salaria]
MSRLIDLHVVHGQSPWLDNMRRDWLVDGQMQDWIDRGVRGMTSNPTIFQKAIAGGEAYDDQFADLVGSGTSVIDAYWEMVVDDIEAALGLLRPVHDASGGEDGFVSVEVSPLLARDTDGTLEAARGLNERIARPNLYVKIPGTAEGLPAIRQMITEGRSVNVTLLFSVERYREVMEAYLSGLEANDGDLSAVSSVASFFVSRVDGEADKRLDAVGTPEAAALKGKVAVANAQRAYQAYLETFSGPRWEALAARGARVQRPLWASTSTKNPAYPDTLYVDTLIGPDTVNTMPEGTLADFDDHGTLARTVDADPAAAEDVLEALAGVGVELADITRVLEDQGVASFSASFDDLLGALEQKAATFR